MVPSQTTHGPQSPNIDSGGGSVNVTYGVPQKVVDRLNELLDAKDIALTDRDAPCLGINPDDVADEEIP